MLDSLRREHFSTRIGSRFAVPIAGADPIPLELVATTDLGAAQLPGGRCPFSLLLLGPPGDLYFRQGVYRIMDEVLGELELFVVPLGPLGARMRYEVIFT
jgi:hypothetical protein